MSKKLTLSKIKEIVSAYLAKHGRFPSPRDMNGFDVIGFPGETAGALNSCIRNGGRGLDLDPEWLAFKASLPAGTKPSISMLDPSNQFTIALIRSVTGAYKEKYGHFPTAASNALFDKVGLPGETSSSVNSALRSGGRGLQRDPEWRDLKQDLSRGSALSLAMFDPFHNLKLSDIRRMTEASQALRGRYPSVGQRTSFDECGFPGETALSLDSSIRIGGRGLDKDPEWIEIRDSLPPGMVPTLASLDRSPLLTLQAIKTAIAEVQKLTGRFPSVRENTTFSTIGLPRESASTFDAALRSGGRGLALDDEWIALRDSLPQNTRPSLAMLNPFNQLTVAKIREMLVAYAAKFGEFPKVSKNLSFDQIGFPGESVKALNSVMRRGGRGLSMDPEWQEIRSAVPQNSSPSLSMLDPSQNLTLHGIRKIIESAVRKNGRPPSVVQDTPLGEFSFPGESARTLDKALKNGWRGLSRDPEWKALSKGMKEGSKPTLPLLTTHYFPSI